MTMCMVDIESESMSECECDMVRKSGKSSSTPLLLSTGSREGLEAGQVDEVFVGRWRRQFNLGLSPSVSNGETRLESVTRRRNRGDREHEHIAT